MAGKLGNGIIEGETGFTMILQCNKTSFPPVNLRYRKFPWFHTGLTLCKLSLGYDLFELDLFFTCKSLQHWWDSGERRKEWSSPISSMNTTLDVIPEPIVAVNGRGKKSLKYHQLSTI